MAKPTDPADTRMMGIVHGALQRDLLRAREAAASTPYPVGRQRRALGRARGVADGLPAPAPHERGRGPVAGGAREEPGGGSAAGLPRGRPPGASSRPRPRCAALPESVRRSIGGRRSPRDLVMALDDLAAVLFAHLDREVAEAMPVVSATITDGEWQAIEEKYYTKTKSLARARFRGPLADRRDRSRGLPRGDRHRARRTPVHPAARFRPGLPTSYGGHLAAGPRCPRHRHSMSTAQEKPRREYRSPRRQQQAAETRAAVLDGRDPTLRRTRLGRHRDARGRPRGRACPSRPSTPASDPRATC